MLSFIQKQLLNFCTIADNVLNTWNTIVNNKDKNLCPLGVNILAGENRPKTNEKQIRGRDQGTMIFFFLFN